MKIGVVSDTHGAIHPGVFDYLEGVEIILHAGDIGGEDILLELESIAPVKAVIGNTDTFPITERCKKREIIEIDGKSVYLTHRVIEGQYKIPHIMEDIKKLGPDVVVFGHTHNQHAETIDGILFYNPGSAGQERPGKRLAVGVLDLEKVRIKHDTYYLD